jgi:glutaredoxin 3
VEKQMPAKVTIYTKDNCPYCVSAKNLLEEKGKEYKEINIGRDIRRDDFMSLFPNVKTVPHIIINGDEIGGFDKLTEWLDTTAGRSFLAE